jgi:hypothetical protein
MTKLAAAARDRWAVAPERILMVGGPTGNGGHYRGATKAEIEQAIRHVAGSAEPDARVFIVLFGHGSAVGGEARFNIPGPDLTANDFATLLARFGTQEVVFANLTSASGDFVAALAGPRRTVITATKSGFERNESRFAGHFVEALAGTSADLDKDDRVSVREAFVYARREVEREYERDRQLLTEHALLDDDGDGQGTGAPAAERGDGTRAATLFLDDRALAAEQGVADPELARLYRERRELEQQLARLRAAKSGIDASTYETELERLLLQLARVGQAIREKGGSGS